MTRHLDRNLAGMRRCELPLELLRGWPVPAMVETEGEYLFWCYGNYATTLEITPKLMRQLLKEFIQLGDQKDSANSDILEFARTWGVLNICSHGLPSNHISRTDFQEGFDYVRCEPQQHGNGMFYEPLAMWRAYARRIKALDNIITDMRRTQEADSEDWQILTSWLPTLSKLDKNYEDRVGLVINRVLEIADLRPQFAWRNNELVFTLAHVSDSRLSLLTGALIWVALHHRFSDLFTICAACSAPIEIAYGRSFRKKHYCADCGVKAAWREAAKRYRQKNRENPSREKRKKSRLTQDQVRDIRQRIKIAKGKNSWLPDGLAKQLASEYDVSESTIYKIDEGKIWKHVK